MLPDRNILAFEDFAVGEPTLALLRGRLLSTSEELVLRELTVTGLTALLASSFPSALGTSAATSLLIKL